MERQNHFERWPDYHIFHVLIVIQRGDLCIVLCCKQGWSDDLVNPGSSVIDWMMMDKTESFARQESMWHFIQWGTFRSISWYKLSSWFSNDNKCRHISLFASGNNSLWRKKNPTTTTHNSLYSFHIPQLWTRLAELQQEGKHHDTNAIKVHQSKTWGVFLLELCQLSYHSAGNHWVLSRKKQAILAKRKKKKQNKTEN